MKLKLSAFTVWKPGDGGGGGMRASCNLEGAGAFVHEGTKKPSLGI